MAVGVNLRDSLGWCVVANGDIEKESELGIQQGHCCRFCIVDGV